MSQAHFKSTNYKTEAEPRTTTKDKVPVFCSFDELLPIAELVPNPHNPNTHSDHQIALLADIIKATGWRAPITVSKRSGFIVKGHGRRMAALRNAAIEVPVEFQDYTSEAEEYADLIADNRISELAEIDKTMLADLIEQVDMTEVPVELTGFAEKDIENILAEIEAEKGTENEGKDDDIEITVPFTKPGDMWILGNHRLICGDSTDEEVIERLMQGEKAQLVFTDPPYGVSYEAASGKFEAIENDDLTHDDLMKDLLIPVFRNCVKNSYDNAAFYIWHASSTRRDFEDAMTAVGLLEKQYLIWAKNGFQMGRADYHWGHEPCFYAEKAGHSAKWYGDRTQQTVIKVVRQADGSSQATMTNGLVITDGEGNKVFVSDQPPKNKKLRYIRAGIGEPVFLSTENKQNDIWEVARESGAIHPTQKPVELAERAIENSSEKGDLVIDYFLGSGCTLIGAEITGRRCYGAELDPDYCDGIARRFFNLTKKKDIHVLRDGETINLNEILNFWNNKEEKKGEQQDDDGTETGTDNGQQAEETT